MVDVTEHNCRIAKEPTIIEGCKWYQKLILMSPENPLRLDYFRSEVSVREEHNRHLEINKYAIHPFSKFRAWYELYLVFLYASVLITKPLDAGFLKSQDCKDILSYKIYNFFTDFLCWIDISLNFVTGYERKRINAIELRTWNIAKHYMLGPYFIFDILSSFPRCLMYSLTALNAHTKLRLLVAGVTAILNLLKAVRIISFVKYIWRTADYFRFESKGALFVICTLFGSLMIVHWLACLQFAIPRFVRINFTQEKEKSTSWFYDKSLYNGTLYTEQKLSIRYNHCFLKSSAYILGIRINLYGINEPEEYILAMFTYFVGKILIAFVWIILAVAILNARIMELKFAEIINQLQEYTSQKQLPMNLRGRIFQYFIFKYRNKYFEEDLIAGLLSENINNETNVYACRFLIDNVSLFQGLNSTEISKLVNHLESVIFLPNDTIIHAGSQGDAMYFVYSGTVAVYTRSGKEICHLQDGAYFGEISLVMKRQFRSATVVALEISHVYKLKKKDLEKCLLKHKSITHKILKNAEKRLKETLKMEEEYKEVLLEESMRKISTFQ